MIHWNPDIDYLPAVARLQEDVARGEEAQRLAAVVGTRSVRDRLATALVALARQLDPEMRPAPRDGTVAARATV